MRQTSCLHRADHAFASSLPFQRGFEQNYEWETEHLPGGKKQPSVSTEDYFKTDKLFWALRGLGFDEARLFTMDPSFHFRVLDDTLSHADRKQKARLGEHILRHASDMAAVDEIRIALECDRFWDREGVQQADVAQHPFRHDFIQGYAKKLCLPELVKRSSIAVQLKTLCEKNPWPKGPMNQTWLDRATDARATLDRLWDVFRISLESQQRRKGFPEYFIEEDRLVLTAATRAEHLAVLETEQLRTKARCDNKENNAPTVSPAITPALSHDTSPPEKFKPAPIREKKKTRGQTDSTVDIEQSVDILTDQLATLQSHARTDACRSIEVKPENFRLFTAM